MPRISENGLKLIRNYEGLRTTAYLDSNGAWTIGFGHTGPDVFPGKTITPQEAERLLQQDLRRFEGYVQELIGVVLNQNQFDALVSFTYNVGKGAFLGSTLRQLVNQKNFTLAAAQFERWVHGDNGNVLQGLVKRRKAEKELFIR